MTQSEGRITTLFRGYANSNTYVWSPFVTKLEFRFRYSNLPYRVEAGSTRQGPKGKVPYVDVSALADQPSESNQDLLADSRLIIQNLINRGILDDLNKDLTPVQRMMDLALRALLEERLYFLNVRACNHHPSQITANQLVSRWPKSGSTTFTSSETEY